MRASMSLKVIIFWALCATTAAEHAPEIKDLVDWFLSSPGTVFNEKQDIRHEDPSDPSTILGVFAKENISEGELLMSIPYDLIIQPEELDEFPPQLACETAFVLAAVMR